jgi:hypothetical protein
MVHVLVAGNAALFASIVLVCTVSQPLERNLTPFVKIRSLIPTKKDEEWMA